MKYYFLVYEWRNNRHHIAGGLPYWNPQNIITDKHPLEWLKSIAIGEDENYSLKWWTEITKEHYDKFAEDYK